MADINLINYEVIAEYDTDGDGVNDTRQIKVFYNNEDIYYQCAIPITMTDEEIKNFLLEKLNNRGY